jgi:hypothetical protein
MDPDAPPLQLAGDSGGYLPSQWLQKPEEIEPEEAQLVEEGAEPQPEPQHTEQSAQPVPAEITPQQVQAVPPTETSAEEQPAPVSAYTEEKLAEGEKQAEIAEVAHESPLDPTPPPAPPIEPVETEPEAPAEAHAEEEVKNNLDPRHSEEQIAHERQASVPTSTDNSVESKLDAKPIREGMLTRARAKLEQAGQSAMNFFSWN